MIRKVLDLLLPNRCVITGQIVQDPLGLTPEGFARIQFITTPCCRKCGAPLKYFKEVCLVCLKESFAFQEARSVFVYNDDSKKLILQYKYGDHLNLSPLFAEWLVRCGLPILATADWLVPVPLHLTRLRKRLYNQAAELVKATCKLTNKD